MTMQHMYCDKPAVACRANKHKTVPNGVIKRNFFIHVENDADGVG